MPEMVRKKELVSPVSFIDKIAQLEKAQGRKVIRFDLAEPQFPPPQAVIEGTIRAIRRGEYRYASSWGIPELCGEVAKYLGETRSLNYSDSEILITTGGKFANFAFFSSLFRRGDRVLILSPYWTSFRVVPEMLDLEVTEVIADDPYHLNNDILVEAMAKHPKGIVINTPNNPTGGMFNEADIRILSDLAQDYNLLVLSDEIDWAYAYDGRRHLSPALKDELRERTIITDGFSKVFAMTGWRIGFAAGPSRLISKMHTLQEHSIGSPVTFVQSGSISALRTWRGYVRDLVRKTDANRQIVVKALNEIAGLKCPMPEGGFYAYPWVSPKYSKNIISLTEEMLVESGVSVIPGVYFGDKRMRFRLSYALEKGVLVKGLERIREYFENHAPEG